MRIALFGSGGAMPEAALRSLAKSHEVMAVVRPKRSLTLRSTLRPIAVSLGLRQPEPLLQAAGEFQFPLLSASSGRDASLASALKRLNLDLMVIASFPYVLGEEVYSTARFGAVNLHPSLLPRHRGPLPMFWVYHENDRETGVTVHRVSAKADCGEILEQVRFDLPRGHPIQQLYVRSSDEGARIVGDVLSRMESGPITGTSQDERLVTKAPRLKPGVSMVDFANWPVERVWHFLKGMYPQFVESLHDAGGKPVTYSGVRGFVEETHAKTLGSVQAIDGGWRLFCKGGSVNLDANGKGN